MIAEPENEQKKLRGVIRMMQQMANVERDEDCSVVMGNEVLPVVTRFGLPVFLVILPATMKGLNAPEKTVPTHDSFQAHPAPYGIDYPSKIVHRCTMIS